MKKLMIIAVLAFVANTGFSQATTASKSDMAIIQWDAATYDFGKIKQGVPVTHEFKFTNKGKVPAVITNAQPSCGCTVPDWTHEPIPVGGSGYVKAEFDTNGKTGVNNKTITVTANTWPKTTTLRFKAMVTPKTELNGPTK